MTGRGQETNLILVTVAFCVGCAPEILIEVSASSGVSSSGAGTTGSATTASTSSGSGMGGTGGMSTASTSSSTSGTGGGGTTSEAVAYQIDVAHTGSQSNEALTPPLTQRWSVDLGGAVSYPLIAGGRVFVTVGHGGFHGTDLYALDQATGAVVWGPTDLGGMLRWSGAAYDAGKVFAVNFEGLLRAFDAASGAQLWMLQLPGVYGFSSLPTAIGGLVYLSGDGSLYAVDEADGTIKWTQMVQNGDSSAPAVSASGVYVSYTCDQVYSFAPATGLPLWHHSIGCEGGGGRTPALFAGKLYVRDWDVPNVVLDAQTGTSLGTFAAGPIPALGGTRGFFLAGGVLSAQDLGSSTTAWTFSGDGQLSVAPIVVNGYVYIGSSAGNLYALDEAQGTTAWSSDLGAGIAGPAEDDPAQPVIGLAAAAGALIVPASQRVVAFW